MLKSFILFVLLVIPSVCLGAFEPGYIVQGADTLRGELRVFSNGQSYIRCVFRKDGIEREYLPGQIQAYGFDAGRVYRSGMIKGKFAAVLVDGQASLYKVKSEYLVQRGGAITDTVYISTSKKKVEKDGEVLLIKDLKWKGRLSNLLTGCSGIDFKSVSPNQSSLLQLIEEYNTCKGEDFVNNTQYFRMQIKTRFNISASGVYTYGSAYSFEGADVGVDGAGWLVGGALEVYPFRVYPRLGVSFGFNYQVSELNGRLEQNDLPLFVDRSQDIEIDIKGFSFQTLITYRFPITEKTTLQLFGGYNLMESSLSEQQVFANRTNSNTGEVVRALRYGADMEGLVGSALFGVSADKSVGKVRLGITCKYAFQGKYRLREGQVTYYSNDLSQLALGLTISSK